MLIQTHRLAWAAGFADGEGCFTIGRSGLNRSNAPYVLPEFKISQFNDPDILWDFVGAVHMGNVTGPYSQRLGKEIYHYEISGFPRVQALYAMLFKYLSSVKREQGRKVLQEYLDFERTRIRKNNGWKNFHRAK